MTWPVFDLLQPITPVVWILFLFLAAMALPNSLEMLRSLSPALDYPQIQSRAAQSSEPGRWRSWLNSAEAARHSGLFSSPAMGWVIALLGVLGLMALNQSVGFVYAKF